MFGYFIVAVICGFIGSMIAGYKSRSTGLWFFLGFIFPISLLYLAIVKPSGTVAGKWLKCPHCAEVIKWEAKICPHCRNDVSPESIG